MQFPRITLFLTYVFLATLPMPALAVSDGSFNFWPFYSRDNNVFGEERVRAIGPIFQRLESTNGASFLGVHPLYSQTQNPEDHNRRDHHVLWPLWLGHGADKEYSWQVLALMFWRDYDVTQPRSRHHLWLLPFFFCGRNASGDPYVALFPIGGKIYDFMLSDELTFVMFPLYGHSALGDQKTLTALWPVYSRTTGPHNQRWRVFPFYGRAQSRNYYDKLFVLWPIWSQGSYTYKKASGYSHFLFPLWGHLNVTDQEAWWILPPLVRISTRGANKLYYLPWPFIQIGRGEVEKLYLWPLYGHKTAYGLPYTFALWPIIRYWWEYEEGGLLGDQLMIMPFWYSRTRIKPAAAKRQGTPEIETRQSRFWPFYTYKREGVRSKLGAPALCPFRDIDAIERNYAPLWTVYARQRNGSLVEDDLLWGLFRYRRGPDEKHIEFFPFFSRNRDSKERIRAWSLLKGLVAREERGEETSFTLLYALTWRIRNHDQAGGTKEP